MIANSSLTTLKLLGLIFIYTPDGTGRSTDGSNVLGMVRKSAALDSFSRTVAYTHC